MRRPVNPQKGRSVAKRGCLSAENFLGKSQSRAPSPAKRASSSFLLAFGGDKSPKGDSLYGSPPGRFFCPCKRNQNRVKGDRFPLDKPLSGALLRWIRKAFFPRKKPSVLHADGLNKVSQMHLPPPGLPRFGGGERPPFCCKPPAPLTITMGQRPRTLQAANQKEFAFLPHSPPPLRGKELERRRWRMQRQFLGERHEQCKRERRNATMERPGPDRGGGSPFCAPAQRR